jgi:hypothetical protein
MATAKPVPIKSLPGIRRDGTQFDGQEYTDGQWVRFYRGRPKKMAGYQVVTALPEIARGINSYQQNLVNYVHLGGISHLTQVQVNSKALYLGQDDRTPAGFATNPDNLWQQDIMYTTSGGVNNIVVHPAPNLSDISSAVETPIYYGPVTGTSPLVTSAMPHQSGGIVAVYPYLISYGNYGRVDCSGVNDLANPPITGGSAQGGGEAFVTGQKIVKGLPLRNAGGPAFLLWSLDSLIMCTFNPVITLGIPFNFNTVSDTSSILSSDGVIEYDGIYFWAGVDRFLMFNGVVREVPNQMNLDFFFSRINMAQRQKAFVFKVPRWGEIWWCFPLDAALECNHAVIYNIREGSWYDTALPGLGRTCGYFPSTYPYPLLADPGSATGPATLWQHETGVDSVDGASVQPIQSYFTSDEKEFLDQGLDKCMRVDMVEPDLKQINEMTLTVSGRANARSTDIESQSVAFPDTQGTPLPPDEQVVRFKESRRLLRFRFESNVVGGDYYMGKTLAHIEPSEGRITQ